MIVSQAMKPLSMEAHLEIVNVNLSAREKAKEILKRELAQRRISYPQLADLMTAKGWSLSKASLDNKMSRGTFSADFFLDALRAIGCVELIVDKTDCDEVSNASTKYILEHL